MSVARKRPASPRTERCARRTDAGRRAQRFEKSQPRGTERVRDGRKPAERSAEREENAAGIRIGGWGGIFLRRTPWEIPQEAFPAERECRGGASRNLLIAPAVGNSG